MNLILCDFDYTIYDTERMKIGWHSKLYDEGVDTFHFLQSYDIIMYETGGYIDPEKLYRKLDKHQDGWGKIARNVIENYPYDQHVSLEAVEALELIRTLGTLIIWSLGEESFQKHKIEQCNLPVDGIYVSPDKVGNLEELLSNYDYKRLVVIDDREHILSKIPDDAIKIHVGEDGNFKTIKEAAVYLAGILSKKR